MIRLLRNSGTAGFASGSAARSLARTAWALRTRDARLGSVCSLMAWLRSGDGGVAVAVVVVELAGDDRGVQDLERLGDVRVVLADEHVDPRPGLRVEEQVPVAVGGDGLDLDGEPDLGGR